MPDNETETGVLKLLTTDVQEHRKYIQHLYKTALWLGTSIIATAFVIVGGTIYWFVGEQFDSKIIDYVVDKNVTKRIQIMSDSTIESAREAAIQKVGKFITEEIGKVAEIKVTSRLNELTSKDLPELLKTITFPAGLIAAFDRPDCPVDWEPFKEAQGKYIVGKGNIWPLLGENISKEKLQHEWPTGVYLAVKPPNTFEFNFCRKK